MTGLNLSRDMAGPLRAALSASTAAVLVVDDNAAKRLALKAILLPLGHAVVEADSGEAALRALMTQDFAVILLDVRMPGMDGFETAALIRQRRQSELTPIIFVTAFTSHEMAPTERYVEGAVDFIFAPVQPDELRAKVSVFADLFGKAEGLAEQARHVQESVDQLRLLTDSAPIGIFQTDAADRYVYTNPQWSHITGISAQDALGRPWDSIVDADSADDDSIDPEHLGNAGPVVPAGRDATAERCHRFEVRRDGAAPRIVVSTSRPVPGADGQINGRVGTLADVTAEAEAAAALVDARDKANEASRMKSDFLATVSHEIRTPMNGVIGMTSLLLETELDARQRNYAETVRMSGEALMVIINDVLDFSKVEAGFMRLEQLDYSVRTVVAEAVDLLARPCQDKGLELLTVVAPDVPEVVCGDPGRVRQVLTNIVNNAIKFTQAGEIVVRVSVAASEVGAPAVRFDVSDTGNGIAADKLVTIFEPFTQADSSTSRKYGGTGLGLAICAQLVELMGGERGVSSTLGQGSTFWFTIGVPALGPAPVTEPDPDLLGVRVLLVDDSSVGLSIGSQIVEDWGMQVTAATTSEDALAALASAVAAGTPYAVAVVDRQLANVADVTSELASDSAPGTRLVLAGVRHDGVPESPDAPAAVRKPLRADELRLCLRSVLGVLNAEVAAIDVPAGVLTPQHGLGRLLLAEDNLVNQMIAVAMLTRGGYSVDTVLDGAAAVRAAAATRYDAILMDCQMPVLDGYQATTAIRAAEGSQWRAPIIALTAGSRAEDGARCLAAGMDHYLTKPISKDVLLAVVAESMLLVAH